MIEDGAKKTHDDVIERVNELTSIIKESEREMIEIQHACTHPKENQKVKDINQSGISDIRKICSICKYVLGYPSKDELDNWMYKNN